MITSDKVAAKKEKKRKGKENNSKITNWSFIKKKGFFCQRNWLSCLADTSPKRSQS